VNAITWLHLSDLHVRGTEGTVDRVFLDKMLADISEQLDHNGLVPDAVFFTGDLAFSGQEEEYTMATTVLDDVLNACGLADRRDKLFIVPGNHDINRKAVKRSHKSVTADLLNPDRKPGEDNAYDRVNEFLSDDDERAWFFRKSQCFGQFIEAFYAGCGIALDHKAYYSVRAIEKGDHTVVVMGLNSAWLSFRDNEQGRLLLGEQQACDAEEEAKEKWPKPRLYIALIHHPLYWLAEKDIHRVQQHLPRLCDVLLRGHLHCPSYTVQSTPDWHLHEFAAGASWKARWHAYNLIQLDLDSGEAFAITRFQHPEFSVEWGADSLTYRHAKEGRIEWSIKLRE
jgi:predicted phosphodiesterase